MKKKCGNVYIFKGQGCGNSMEIIIWEDRSVEKCEILVCSGQDRVMEK